VEDKKYRSGKHLLSMIQQIEVVAEKKSYGYHVTDRQM
jgi:hypothetical protein